MKPKLPLLFAPAVAVAVNADALPEWIQLAPYGDHPTRDKKRVQVFNAEAAAQIVQWFDFFPRRLARLMGINACPVWVGHPDFDPQTWPERRQIGSLKELEAREDGLWGKVAWNADAEVALRDEGHKFPSVAWECDEINAEQLAPALLWSVGMWHKPNIKSVQPVINAEGYDLSDDDKEDDDDSLTSKDTQTPTAPPAMLNKILAALKEAGIVKDGDSDDTVLAAVGNLIANLAYTREEKARQAARAAELRTAINAADDAPEDELIPGLLAELNTARETLAARDAALTELNAARIDDALTLLIETGRVSKADEASVRTELNTDLAGTLAKFKERPVKLNTARLDLGAHKGGIATSTETHNKLLDWCNQRITETNCSWDQAWEASKTDAVAKAYHEALKTNDAARAS